MRLDVITIFPEYLDPLRHALLGRAIERGILDVAVHDLRSWTHDVHKAVDDTPYGGGPGMVMKPTVWGPALDDVAALTGPAQTGRRLESSQPHVAAPSEGPGSVSEEGSVDDPAGGVDDRPLLIVPTPVGAPFTQQTAQRWSQQARLVFACGRYEGIDQRVFDDAANRYRVEEVSLGDYVLIGGEVAVLVMAEAVVRLIPGVLGNRRSHEEESFQDGLLEGPSYTKPKVWRDLEVPPVLLSGDHAKVDRWRRDQALERTRATRPDLIETLRAQGGLDKHDRRIVGD